MEKQNDILFDVNAADLMMLKKNPKKFWNNVQVIGYGCFENCKDLIEIVLPKDVWSIGSCAFRNCSSLETVKIKSNFVSIANDAFDGCKNLKKIVFLNPVGKADIKIEKFQNLKYFAISIEGHIILCSDFKLGEYEQIITIEEMRNKLIDYKFENDEKKENNDDEWKIFLWSLFGLHYGPQGDAHSDFNCEMYVPAVSFIKRICELIKDFKDTTK